MWWWRDAPFYHMVVVGGSTGTGSREMRGGNKVEKKTGGGILFGNLLGFCFALYTDITSSAFFLLLFGCVRVLVVFVVVL
jgi:hypothetical protein